MDSLDHVLPEIRHYLEHFLIPEDALQQRLRAQARLDGLEHWLIPAEVGRFFSILTLLSGAKRVYEIGSYLGYSATWFARVLPEEGLVVLTENNEHRYQQAVDLLPPGTFKSTLVVKHCDALQDLRTDPTLYDLLVIDHDKSTYCEAFRLAKTHTKPGGLILADNVLWRNRIVDPHWHDDPETCSILAFNELIMADPDVVSVLIPLGDGVSVSYVGSSQ